MANAVAPPAPQPVSRGPLVEEFRSRYPDFSGTDEELLLDLQGRYRESVRGALGLAEDDPELERYISEYRPVWGNEAQRQAVMAIAGRPGGMDKVRELFPGEYDEGDVSGSDLDSLLPPGARRVLEAGRASAYLGRLLDKDRVLTEADVAIGRNGGGNTYREDKTNWFDRMAQSADPVPFTPFGGPNYYGAQESPVAIEVVNNPRASATTGMLGAFNLIPSAIRQGAASGSLLEGLRRSGENFANGLRYDGMNEMPTANVNPHLFRGPKDAQRFSQEDAKLMAATLPPQGQENLANLGVPDSLNSPYLGVASDAITDMADFSAFGAANNAAQEFAKGGYRNAIRPLVNDTRNEVIQGAAASGAFGFEETPEHGWKTEAMVRETSRPAALAEQRKRVPVPTMRRLISEANPALQNMAATNPHVQADFMKRAEEEHEKQSKRPLFSGLFSIPMM